MNGIAAGSATSGHTVLLEADSSAYQSLRQRPVTRAERYALGKSLRKRVPRRSLADWEPPRSRVVAQIRQFVCSSIRELLRNRIALTGGSPPCPIRRSPTR